MNNRILNICSSVILLSSVVLSAAIQAQTLNDVLDQARSVREAETALFQQRITDFNATAAADQQRLMREAAATRTQIQAAVQEKTNQFSANDLQISTLNVEMREKANTLGLGELFGLARQVAGDSSTILEQSLVNAQYASEDSRVAFLRDFSQQDTIASIAQLERVWFEIQREMTASGEVARYTGTVVEPNGDALTAEVVRIGPFTATADGQFLAYIPNLSRLSIMPRQLPEEFLADAAQLHSATQGYVTGVVDSTRGVLTSLYVERPTIGERIEKGEEVGYVIIVVGTLGLLAFIYQLIYLVRSRMAVTAQMKNLQKPINNNALGRVLLSFKGDGGKIEEDSEVAELRISEAVMKEVPSLERFQPFLRLAVAAGPLLGLVGTVVGMIITFQSITESGSSDPKLMANGIGQAMIATVLGLGIAVPLLFAGALLNSLSRSIVQILDEQSTGILAENIEKRKHV
ncbi:MAG: MotA/TolQ/ExbB proton channel family protein [Pseudohongiellaceae bacterium]